MREMWYNLIDIIEDFMKYLGQKGISVFSFNDKKEFLDELNNA